MVIFGTAIYIYNLSIDKSDLLFQSRNTDLLSFKNKIILGLAYIGIFISFYNGALACLSWLPDSWGAIDEGGEFISFKKSLSSMLSFTATYFIIRSLEKNYHFCLMSLLKSEELKYRDMINNQFTNRSELKRKLEELHNYQKELTKFQKGASGGRYRFISQKKELIYRRLLISLEEKENA